MPISKTRTLFGCIYFVALCFICTGVFGIPLPAPVPNMIPNVLPTPSSTNPASLTKLMFHTTPLKQATQPVVGPNNTTQSVIEKTFHTLINVEKGVTNASVKFAIGVSEGENLFVSVGQATMAPVAVLEVESVNIVTTEKEFESILKGTLSQHVRSKESDWGAARCGSWIALLVVLYTMTVRKGNKGTRLCYLVPLLILVIPTAVLGQCDNCTDAVSSHSCPYPELCGFASISCINCLSTPSSGCLHPEWCVNVTCSSMCMPGMPMDGCQDPGACGFQPTACSGCIVGNTTVGCANPEWCTACADPAKCPPHDTPPCWKCELGESTRDCPDPTKCGLLPPPPSCVGCVVNSSTPGCPNVTLCGGNATFPCLSCVAGSITRDCPDPSWCNLAPACFGCGTAITGNVGCPNPVACGVALSFPCVNCMEGMYMDTCPLPQLCPVGGNNSIGSCPMSMAFSASSSVCVLLSSWYVQNVAQWALLALGVLALALTREFFVVHRQHRARIRRLGSIGQTINKGTDTVNRGDKTSLLLSDSHISSHRSAPAPSSLRLNAFALSVGLVDCAYYAVTVACAYLLMLLVMTYNVMLFLLVVALSAVAHLLINVAFAAYWRSATRGAMARSGGWSDELTSVTPTATGSGSYVAPLPVDEVKAASDPCCADIDVDLE